jgi:hypothetical protein
MSKYLALLAVLLCGAASAWADDGAMDGVGGALHAMKEHPSIVMQSEVVTVRISDYTADVRCLFVFHNTGQATTVKMGFPESGGGDGVDTTHPRGFDWFRSWVDGKPVRTKTEGLTSGETRYHRWRTKQVKFGAGQTRRVEVRYRAGLGGVSDGSCTFTYVMSTGASWKGKIGHAKVTIRFVDMPGASDSSARPINGTVEVKEWRDAEPEDIGIGFYPAPPTLAVDGKPLEFDLKTPPLPQFIYGQLLVPARPFAKQIGATMVWDPGTETATFTRGDKQVAAKMQGGGPGTLTLRRASGGLVVGANEVIEALGGAVTWSERGRHLVATLPPLPRAKTVSE